MIVLALVLAVGCTKASGKEVAQTFNENIVSAPCVYNHEYITDNVSLNVWRDADGNAKAEYNYIDDGVKETFYFKDDNYTYYLNDELANQDHDLYTEEELQGIIESVVDDITFYPNNYIGVFDENIDSTASENAEKNAFEAKGTYEDNEDPNDQSGGTKYVITYGKEADYFELKDDFDTISIKIDDTVSVTLPQ